MEKDSNTRRSEKLRGIKRSLLTRARMHAGHVVLLLPDEPGYQEAYEKAVADFIERHTRVRRVADAIAQGDIVVGAG